MTVAAERAAASHSTSARELDARASAADTSLLDLRVQYEQLQLQLAEMTTTATTISTKEDATASMQPEPFDREKEMDSLEQPWCIGMNSLDPRTSAMSDTKNGEMERVAKVTPEAIPNRQKHATKRTARCQR